MDAIERLDMLAANEEINGGVNKLNYMMKTL